MSINAYFWPKKPLKGAWRDIRVFFRDKNHKDIAVLGFAR